MARCEDYPCCGHGPAPYGDGGGCPNADGSFNCATCGGKLPKKSRSAICQDCHRRSREHELAGFDDDPFDSSESDYY